MILKVLLLPICITIFSFWQNITSERKNKLSNWFFFLESHSQLQVLFFPSSFRGIHDNVSLSSWGVMELSSHFNLLMWKQIKKICLMLINSTPFAFGFKLFYKTELVNNSIFCSSWQLLFFFVICWISW